MAIEVEPIFVDGAGYFGFFRVEILNLGEPIHTSQVEPPQIRLLHHPLNIVASLTLHLFRLFFLLINNFTPLAQPRF